MRLTSKGQVTIPLALRERLGLFPGTEVLFDIVDETVRIRKARQQSRGASLVERMREVGRRAAGSALTTDEIMALTRGE
jgi:AbrB family looped-hinge helix DNA binding protein